MGKENLYIIDGERVSKDKYNSIKFDSFLTRVAKGRKNEIQAHAQKQGESLNGFVNRAIDETIERDCDSK